MPHIFLGVNIQILAYVILWYQNFYILKFIRHNVYILKHEVRKMCVFTDFVKKIKFVVDSKNEMCIMELGQASDHYKTTWRI